MIQAYSGLLVVSGANTRVVEVTRFKWFDPGAVQTVSARKKPGFGCKSLSGNFALSFKGKATAALSEEFKEALEALQIIHTAIVKPDHRISIGAGDCASRAWDVTLTHLVHENRQEAGIIGLLYSYLRQR